ncbi:restriction endonuclease subunit S [Kitasatospora cineracea]|uniref:restriction endonuclease subunit S n=1 Tax=Kitasatospora cineracea TaxID=88074 RepID=UPI0037918ED9
MTGSNRLPYAPSAPESWEVVPLKFLAELANGYVFKSDEWADSGTPIIRIENLNGSGNFNYSRLELPRRYRVGPGELLFAWSGNPGTSFGPFRWDQPGLHFLNQHIFNVSVHGCEKDWLFWSLRAATRWIERELTSGMIGMVHVTKEELKNVPIPVPPLDEQRRIANFLDAESARIDQLASVRLSQLNLLEERESALLDLEIDGLMASGAVAPLRRFVWSVDQGASPQCEAVPAREGEWGVLKVSCLRPGSFFPGENKRLPSGVEPMARSEVREGDLLITRANTPQLVGSTAVVPAVRSKLLLSDKIFRVRLTRGMLPEFVAELARGSRIRALCAASSNGASQSMANIRFEEVKAWPVPVVSVAEQRLVVERITNKRKVIEALRRAIDSQRALLAERRQALITAAVTGQFDVSTASGRGVTE